MLVDPTNLSPWPTIVREPPLVDGDDEAGAIRFSSEHSYTELARSTPPHQPRCVVISGSDGRWQRQPPMPGEFRWWEPLTLSEVDQRWQSYQRQWVHRLGAQHVVADTAGHFVHRDEPNFVTHVVKAVIVAARSGRPVHLDPAAVAANAGRLNAS